MAFLDRLSIECSWKTVIKLSYAPPRMDEDCKDSTANIIIRCRGHDFYCHRDVFTKERRVWNKSPNSSELQKAWSMIGEVNTPLPPQDIAECCICLETLHQHVITKCGHHFHKRCITQVMQRQGKCPLCRARLNHGEGVASISAEKSIPGVEIDEDPAVM